MTNATPIFPLSPEHRDRAIVGLACHGTHARAIAAGVEVDTLTVCEALTHAGIEPILPPRTFRFENIDWDTDGEVVKRLPRSGEITVEDCPELDDEEVEYEALNDFSDLHGYCIEGCNACEVPGAAWPTTPQEAEALVNEANWTGELRMGNGRYALVTRETLALRYPRHLAFIQFKVGPSYDENVSAWAFAVIDPQNVEGFQMLTNNLLDLIPCALEHYDEGEQKAFEAVWSALVDMGLKHSQPPTRRRVCRTFRLERVEWAGKWKKTRRLPTSGEVRLVEFEDSMVDGLKAREAATQAFANKHHANINRCMAFEVFHV